MTAAAGSGRPAYRRILLKLSGEALAGNQGYGIDLAHDRSDRLRGARRGGTRGADRDRHRRRQHLPRSCRERRRHGARHRRLHGDAGDGHQRAGSPGRAREGRPADAGPVGHRDAGGRRALYPTALDPSPREGAHRNLRGGHGQPVLHDGHRGSPAGRRDRCRRDHEGDEGRRDLLGRPQAGRQRPAAGARDVHRGPQPGASSHGRHRDLLAWTTSCRSRLRPDPVREHHGRPRRNRGSIVSSGG